MDMKPSRKETIQNHRSSSPNQTNVAMETSRMISINTALYLVSHEGLDHELTASSEIMVVALQPSHVFSNSTLRSSKALSGTDDESRLTLLRP